ncbi:MAG TPA: GNAT family N-acetyltransferase [Anaerolineales bacterium]|nr:GNAT family N-acetyltransferase [Anaerolineales bacterium]
MFTIRLATQNDIDEICALDQIARQDAHRVEFIQRAISAQTCYVGERGQIVGYAVLDYSFFEMGFVSMLYIHPDWRRHGAGVALMRHCETVCRTEKLFTSTNLSNAPMQALLARSGYQLSGVIHDLDENDPELVYVKRLGRD